MRGPLADSPPARFVRGNRFLRILVPRLFVILMLGISAVGLLMVIDQFDTGWIARLLGG
jgi:hypothetical protein